MLANLRSRATLHRFGKCKSSKYGIVEDFEKGHWTAPFLPLRFFRTKYADVKVLGGAGFTGGNSTAADATKAALGAYGETLERYSIGLIEADLVRRHNLSFNDMQGENRLGPEESPLFAEAQFASADFPFKKWTADLKIAWVLVQDFNTGQPIWVPDAIGHYGTQSLIYQNTSNGCALGSSFESAALGGVLELIERDAIMGFWWNKIAPPRIDMSLIQDPASRAIIEFYQTTGWPVSILDVTTDLGIPAVIACHRGDQKKGQPAFLMAGSASLSMEGAILRALCELYQCSVYGRRAAVLRKFSKDYDNEILHFSDHVVFHAQIKNAPVAQFLFAGAPCAVRPDLFLEKHDSVAAFANLTALLAQKGYRTLASDCTTRDIRSLGFTCVRAIIPGLIPVNSAHRVRPWGVRRLYEFKKSLGLSTHLARLEDFYNYPHPFP